MDGWWDGWTDGRMDGICIHCKLRAPKRKAEGQRWFDPSF